jgi:hypothetical protein
VQFNVLRIGAEEESWTELICRAKAIETVPALAVRVTICVAFDAATVAINGALAAPAGMVMLPGIVTAEELLERETNKPPVGAAAVSVRVQISLPEPVIELLPQEKPLRTAD